MGIIANPASGKDIRRLVAYGSVFNNTEKINIIKRILIALDSFGVNEVRLMPDYSGLGIQAIDDVDISLKAKLIQMEVLFYFLGRITWRYVLRAIPVFAVMVAAPRAGATLMPCHKRVLAHFALEGHHHQLKGFQHVHGEQAVSVRPNLGRPPSSARG